MFNPIKNLFKQTSLCTVKRVKSKFSESNLKKLLESMPKEPKHIQEAQRQRIKIKEKFQKYVPGKVMLQVLGSGAEGAPKALYMFTDQSRYLFNCGEGTQRLAHEHKMKLSKLEHIFITEPTWSNIGGLPGVSLTIQDVGVPQITLHGPEGLDELFIATRRFIVLKDLTIRMADCKPENVFEDNVLSIRYVPIIKSEKSDNNPDKVNNDENVQATEVSISTSNLNRSRRLSGSRNGVESSDDETDYYAHEQSRTRHKPEQLPQVAHEEREQNTAMCYICRLNPRPGALSIEKCVEAGVPPGPLLGRLKAGQDIILESGVSVRSQDVCLPDDPGPVILVVDCPSVEYLDSFVNNDAFKIHQADTQKDDDFAYLIVHFSPSHIMQHPSYQSWISKFSLSTQHLVLNDTNRCMGSVSVHRIQYKLNMLHNDIFPLLGDDGTKILNQENIIQTPSKKLKVDSERSSNCETSDLIENLTVNSRSASPDHLIQANTFCNVHLRPKRGFDRSGELQLIPSQYIEETVNVDGFPEILKELKGHLTNHNNNNVRLYPRVLFLGTGSCIPNKTRNTSGILVQTSEDNNFLMDCGEGTYGQLVRFYGYEKAKKVLCNLNAVYISHLHADHHIGLIGLLKGRRQAMSLCNVEPKPILLLAPRQILSWLHFYHRRFEEISAEYKLIANGDMIMDDKKITETQQISLENNMKMKDVSTVLVRHCPFAFGVSFVHEEGWKITYSGDTMPSEKLVELGMDSNLLIHEATMEDELAHEAIVKMHSTTSQAISIGQKMRAKNILLTHFSQRYAKLPRFNDNFADNVGIAFDNMQVKMDEMKLLPLFNPALRLMFAEHYEELEHKAVKRQLKAERRDASLERKVV